MTILDRIDGAVTVMVLQRKVGESVQNVFDEDALTEGEFTLELPSLEDTSGGVEVTVTVKRQTVEVYHGGDYIGGESCSNVCSQGEAVEAVARCVYDVLEL